MRWVTTAAIAAALSGCGAPAAGDRPPGSSAGDPRAAPAVAAVQAYFEAVRTGDGVAICSRLAPGLRRHVATLQSEHCPGALGAEARRLPESLAGYRVVSGELTGPTARVVVEGQAGSRDELRLVAADGRWLITRAPGLGGS